MSLEEMVSNKKVLLPPRMVIYGGAGLGKSTFASQMPGIIMIPTEAGLDNISCSKLPIAESYDTVMDYLKMIRVEDHKFKGLGIDTLSGLERLIQKEVCAIAGVQTIAEIGFGKGYAAVTEKFIKMLELIEDIRINRGMYFMGVAHEQVEEFSPPDGDKYNRYQVDLDKRIVPELIRWLDAMFFVKYKVAVKKVEDNFGKKVMQSIGNSEQGTPRVLFTEERPAHIAKNRYNLPYEYSFEREGVAKLIINDIKRIFAEENQNENGNKNASQPAKAAEGQGEAPAPKKAGRPPKKVEADTNGTMPAGVAASDGMR